MSSACHFSAGVLKVVEACFDGLCLIQDGPLPQARAARPSNSLSSSCSDWPYQDNTDNIRSAFGQLAGEDGLLGLEQLSSLLQEVGLNAPSETVLGLVEATASTQWALTMRET